MRSATFASISFIWLILLLGCEAKSPVPSNVLETITSGIGTSTVAGQSPQVNKEPNVMRVRKVKARWMHWQTGTREVEVSVFSGDMIGVRLFDREPPLFATITNFDAPELDQPFGLEAAERLAELLASANVSAGNATQEGQKQMDDSQAKGILGKSPPVNEERPNWSLQLHGQRVVSIAEVMAEEGLGWYTGRSLSPGGLAMRRAMEAKRGIWSSTEPVAPWVWRELPDELKQSLDQ